MRFSSRRTAAGRASVEQVHQAVYVVGAHFRRAAEVVDRLDQLGVFRVDAGRHLIRIAGVLECLIHRSAPAHTKVHINYD